MLHTFVSLMLVDEPRAQNYLRNHIGIGKRFYYNKQTPHATYSSTGSASKRRIAIQLGTSKHFFSLYHQCGVCVCVGIGVSRKYEFVVYPLVCEHMHSIRFKLFCSITKYCVSVCQKYIQMYLHVLGTHTSSVSGQKCNKPILRQMLYTYAAARMVPNKQHRRNDVIPFYPEFIFVCFFLFSSHITNRVSYAELDIGPITLLD